MPPHIKKASIINRPTNGGTKKQGTGASTSKRSLFVLGNVAHRASPPTSIEKRKISTTNQLGSYSFIPSADGSSNKFRNYTTTIVSNFQNTGNFDTDPFFNTVFDHKSIDICNNGTGTGSSGGFISQAGDEYSSPYYASTGGQRDSSIINPFPPIPEHTDLDVFYLPDNSGNLHTQGRNLVSNTIPGVINAGPSASQHEGGVVSDYAIKKIKVSYIPGTNNNGGDKPDMFTNLKLGRLTSPENLYLEFFDKTYNKVGERHILFETKEALTDAEMIGPSGGIITDNSGVKFRWNGYGAYYNYLLTLPTPTMPQLGGPPFPNGTRYVKGQGGAFNVLPATAGYDVSGVSATFYTPNLKTPYTWATTGPYYKPLITYTGPQSGPNQNDPTKFSEKTYTYTLDNMPTYKKGVIGFRIFQERETGGGNDVYGIRYVETEIDYTCYHPEYYILNE